MHTHRQFLGGLFWRLSASYFVATLVAAIFANYAGRFTGPFGVFRDSSLVRWFAAVGSDQLNGSLLFLFVAAIIGTLTGILISLSLTRRLRQITRAAIIWSTGDFSATIRDATQDEVGRLARDLNAMAGQVSSLLAAREQLAVVEERNRLARDLHDTVKQHVFANALLVRAARTLYPRDSVAAQQYLVEAEALASQTQQELINLISALRPPALADRGVVEVLREHAAEWSQHTGISTDVLVEGERETPLDVEDTLFRIAQEALTNVSRHSNAKTVVIQVSWGPERVLLAVQDDGIGFDSTTLPPNSLGLTSMRERAEALGGLFALESSLGRTRVEVSLPVPTTSQARAEGNVYE